ncbi:hypothetical protein [Spiroplasma endosymbiont of Virgichneumon dumeticola]|uniref:hypothetical protein n=1 Tax=Spiroplasma endosymbiont of Virgichneumon dumeticola TaxID=3139323 RepID=UPI0035C88B88
MNKKYFDDEEWLRKKNRRKFSLRLLGLIIITLFLIFDLIITIDYPSTFENSEVPKATERLSIYYAYFTTQTNYLVIIYLFICFSVWK